MEYKLENIRYQRFIRLKISGADGVNSILCFTNTISGMTKSSYPKITIITICYNAEKCIEPTLQSVIEQDYPSKEYIVIDGKSTDDTYNIIIKYKSKIDVLISEKDSGIYNAMNKGLNKSTGDWIIFMNAGDIFASDNIISTVFSNKIPAGKEIIYGDTISKINNKLTPSVCLPLEAIKNEIPFYHQSVFVNRNIIQPFNEKYKILADYDFFYNIYRKYSERPFLYIHTYISIYDEVGVSSDPKNYQICTKERLLIQRNGMEVKWILSCIKYVWHYIIQKHIPFLQGINFHKFFS